MTDPRQFDMDAISRAFLDQGLSHLVRLLQVIPEGHRHRCLLGWRLALEVIADLDEQQLADVVGNQENLAQEVRERFQDVLCFEALRVRARDPNRPTGGG